jgi:hypothetical protein
VLAAQKLPAERVGRDIWKHRFEDINAFERHLWRNGTIIRKFFLHVSRREQQRRLLARLDDPAKNWKFSSGDLVERDKWRAYQAAYVDAIAATSQPYAPWYVVPADHKWFTAVVVADAIVQALEGLDLSLPKATPAEATRAAGGAPASSCRRVAAREHNGCRSSAQGRWVTALPRWRPSPVTR